MAEYTEREASCKDCSHYPVCEDKLFGSNHKNCRHFQNKSDRAEVRHGEWKCTTRAPKRVDGYYYWGAPLETIFVCSECGKAEKNKEPYCNCGAKMDGKGEGAICNP